MSRWQSERRNRRRKRSAKQKNWLLSSPEYAEFVKICQENGWEERESLPEAGTKDEKESGLDEIIKKGLTANRSTDGKQKPLSRDQLNRKFEHWKNSNKIEREIRRVDEAKIDSTEKIIQRLKDSHMWKNSTMRSRVDHRNDLTKTHAELFEQHLLPVLSDLREIVIRKFNELLFDEKSKKNERYTDFELQTIDYFAKRLLSAAGNFVASIDESKKRFAEKRAYSVAYGVMKAYIDEMVMAVKRGGGEEGSMQSNAVEALKEFEAKPASAIMTDNLVNRTMYNISGWYDSAVYKEAARRSKDSTLREVLFSINKNSKVTKDFAQAAGLPTGKVDKMVTTKEDALCYSSYEFYRFTAMLESVCERILIERSIRIFGSHVVRELASVLEENELIIDTVHSLAPGSTDEAVKEAARYLIQTYMNMRSLDFVRQIMGMSRRSLSQGTRPTLGVMASNGKSVDNKSNARKGTICCFFCSEEGHVSSSCNFIEVPPKADEATTKHVNVNIKGQSKTIVWHYCTSCRGWRHHSTAEHDESLEETAEKINAMNSTAEMMSVEDDGEDQD